MKNWGQRIGTKILLAVLSGGRKRRRSGATSCPATALVDVLESRLLLAFDFGDAPFVLPGKTVAQRFEFGLGLHAVHQTHPL